MLSEDQHSVLKSVMSMSEDMKRCKPWAEVPFQRPTGWSANFYDKQGWEQLKLLALGPFSCICAVVRVLVNKMEIPEI